MLDIGFQELLVLMVIALLVFGPDKLPDLGRRLGRALREFRRASDEFRTTIETNLRISEDSILPPSAMSVPTSGDETAMTPLGGEAGDGSAQGTTAKPVAVQAAADIAPSGCDGATACSEPLEPYWMRRGSRLFHRTGCGWQGRVPEADRIPLKTVSDGRDLGLLPCPVCEPQEVEIGS